MSDLTTGPSLSDWSYPNKVWNRCKQKYVSGGMVWRGSEPPTKADIDLAIDTFGEGVDFDVPTFFGYPSFYTRKREGNDPCYSNDPVVLG